ncbi:hypothetical protein M2444_004662 [Paenibacillus sp. PastF-3]|uniref:hypothetical protein n=1 Tax=Paenibacillus sp. PastF-3 TaxID=2940626 RepID=UPI002472FD1B|nr:hypothetical protein [Paenibacillus sp. PastF-3]MDH6372833.1 hypothetical protein [Paenibacillus sp. PastF-3]
MLKLHDWILLRAMFDIEMSDGIMEKNEKKIRQHINDKYSYEMNNGFFEDEPINTDRLHIDHNKDINNEELIHRLL